MEGSHDGRRWSGVVGPGGHGRKDESDTRDKGAIMSHGTG